MKSWKKRWQDELDCMVPALAEHVKAEPIPSPDRTIRVKFNEETPWYKQLFASPARIAACVSACVVGLVAVGASIALFSQTPTVVESSAEVISVEVNPQAAFTVDENGKVTSVVAINGDADVVLAEERYLEMEGKTAEEAIAIFVDYTAQLGYLDLNEPGVMRITSCAENGRLDEVGDTLESYFQGKGAYVAVAEEIVEMQAFCERIQMDVCDTVENLKSSIERIPALFFEREVEGKGVEELETVYRENVPVEGVKDLFASSVAEGEKRIQLFREIYTLYNEILRHDDNPGFILPDDYWTLLEGEIPDTMSALMKEMGEKLLAYETQYGVKIGSASDLASENVTCSLSVLETLTNYVINASVEIFAEQITVVSDILSELGIDTSVFEDLLSVPKTVEEYLVKVEEYAKERFEDLREKGKAAYETVREAISEADYKAYVESLLKEYNSLGEYYNKK